MDEREITKKWIDYKYALREIYGKYPKIKEIMPNLYIEEYSIDKEYDFVKDVESSKPAIKEFLDKQPDFGKFYEDNRNILECLIEATTNTVTIREVLGRVEASPVHTPTDQPEKGESKSEPKNNALHPLAYIYKIVFQDEIEEKFKKDFKLNDNDGNITNLGEEDDSLKVIDDNYRIENKKDIITAEKEKNSLQITHPKDMDVEQSSVMLGLDSMILYMNDSGQSPFELDLDVTTPRFASYLASAIMNKFDKNNKIYNSSLIKGIIINGRKIDLNNVENSKDLAIKFQDAIFPFSEFSDSNVDFNSVTPEQNSDPQGTNTDDETGNSQGISTAGKTGTSNNGSIPQGVIAPQGATAVVPQDEGVKDQGEDANNQYEEDNFGKGIANLNENISKVVEALNALEGNSM